MSLQQIVIYGAGGFAREVAWMCHSCLGKNGEPLYEVVCLIDDDSSAQGKELNGIPVISIDSAKKKYPQAKIVGGVGNPDTRQKLMKKAESVGFGFQTVIHHSVQRSQWIDIGLGTVICAGNILTCNIEIGHHVQINLDCTIGHDVKIGDFSTVSPGVHISGWVHLDRRVFIGTGAVFVNGTSQSPIRIGEGAIIGAGACVTRSVQPNTTVVGIPARPIYSEK